VGRTERRAVGKAMQYLAILRVVPVPRDVALPLDYPRSLDHPPAPVVLHLEATRRIVDPRQLAEPIVTLIVTTGDLGFAIAVPVFTQHAPDQVVLEGPGGFIRMHVLDQIRRRVED